MPDTQSPVEQLRSEEIGFSVYALVDLATLQTLDAHADAEMLPRSFLISRILQQWADEHRVYQSDSLTVDLNAETDPLRTVAA